jgi:hypothetical protein
MAVTTPRLRPDRAASTNGSGAAAAADLSDPRYQAFALLRIAFTVAGVIVALKPRYGAYAVAAWLGAIIVSLLTYSGYDDIALRDFGLMLGALTLARPAAVDDAPRRQR